MGLRRGGGVTVERGAGRGLGVDGVVLPAPAAGLTVRAVHVHDLDTLPGEVPGRASAVAAGALDTDTVELAVAAHPSQQLAVAGHRRRERPDIANPAVLVGGVQYACPRHDVSMA